MQDSIKLTPKQLEFCRQYLIHRNGTKAAIEAGYKEESAQEQASRLLSNDMVKAYLAQAEKERQNKYNIDERKILEALIDIAFFDITEVVQWDAKNGPNFRPSARIKAAGRVLEFYGSPKKGKGNSWVSVKSVDRLRAIELLGKQIGMFKDGKPKSGNDQDSRKAVMDRLQKYFQRPRDE